MKRLKINKLRDKVWREFSKYIRNKGAVGEYNRCITCGKTYDIRELHAGHFRHGKDRKCYFDEENVHPQCISCNNYHKDVAGKRYTLYMLEQYGDNTVEKLLNSPKTIWKRSHLEELYEKYKSLNKGKKEEA